MDESIIYRRSSVRYFTGEPVREDDIREVLRAAMAAPSAHNRQPWEFMVVRDKEKLEQLAHCSRYSGPVGRATACVVVCYHQISYMGMFQQDMGACVENLLLRATELGLGSVWVGIYPEREYINNVKNVMEPPEGVEPFCLVGLGHPAQEPKPMGPSRFDEGRIHWD